MTITVYTTSTCPICHSLMQWLESEHQAYKRVIVDESDAGMSELFEKSGGSVGVPFSVIAKDDGSEEKIFGFDRPKFKTTLGL